MYTVSRRYIGKCVRNVPVLFVRKLRNWGKHTVELDMKQGEIRQTDSCNGLFTSLSNDRFAMLLGSKI